MLYLFFDIEFLFAQQKQFTHRLICSGNNNGMGMYNNSSNSLGRSDVNMAGAQRSASDSSVSYDSTAFPTLSNSARGTFTNPGLQPGSIIGMGSLGIGGGAPGNQQQYLSNQAVGQGITVPTQQQIDEFVIQKEDFPALPKSAPIPGPMGGSINSSTLREGSSSMGQFMQQPSLSVSVSLNGENSGSDTGSRIQGDMVDSKTKFGLLGLLDVIRITDNKVGIMIFFLFICVLSDLFLERLYEENRV